MVIGYLGSRIYKINSIGHSQNSDENIDSIVHQRSKTIQVMLLVENRLMAALLKHNIGPAINQMMFACGGMLAIPVEEAR